MLLRAECIKHVYPKVKWEHKVCVCVSKHTHINMLQDEKQQHNEKNVNHHGNRRNCSFLSSLLFITSFLFLSAGFTWPSSREIMNSKVTQPGSSGPFQQWPLGTWNDEKVWKLHLEVQMGCFCSSFVIRSGSHASFAFHIGFFQPLRKLDISVALGSLFEPVQLF